MFPADVGRNAEFLAKHREPALWTPTALAKHRSRLRVSVDGINCLRVIIRIDESKGQRFNGTQVSEFRCGNRKGFVERRHFAVSRRKMAEFHLLTKREDILQRPRQGWSLPEEEICLDGQEVLIELADSAWYRAAAANMSCTAPIRFRIVAAAIFELAGASDAKKILRP